MAAASRVLHVVRNWNDISIRARDLALELAHDLDHIRDFARNLAVARDLDLDLARDLAVARDLDRNLAVARDLDRALARAFAGAVTRARDLARDLAVARDLAFELARDLDRDRDLVLNYVQCRCLQIINNEYTQAVGAPVAVGEESLASLMDDFTADDLSDADVREDDIKPTGVRWSDGTTWPASTDINRLKRRSDRQEDGSWIIRAGTGDVRENILT
ncbi:hypothetical protein [Streptomyces sp. LUP47B]|uniref:hypothetical protein n=1 Tax=Streptomyces sp. LUP47B TaxID=1890286 RepID=UPI00159EF5FA|nr:hypothetical protein [Streptomyces sp. LUP47B]